MPTEIYEIFHTVYGIDVDTPVPHSIGDFTFYQFPRDRLAATKQYLPNLKSVEEEPLFQHFGDITSVVSVKVEAPDAKTAEDVARVPFAHLTNIFSFLLLEYRDVYNISVFNAKPITKNVYVVVSKSLQGERHCSISGIRRKLELSKLIQLDNRFFINLVENLTNSNLTKMRKKVMLGVDFCGLAIQSIGQASSFVQAITSLECLLSTSKGSISLNVSDNYAFIFGENYPSRIKLKSKVKQLYKRRSDLAHGIDSDVSKEECLEAIFYARNAINAFLMDEKLLNLESEDDFNKYIERLKFGAKEGENA